MNNYIVVDLNFRDKINIEELNRNIENFKRNNPSIDYVINIPSTRGVSSSFVRKINPKAKIRIASSYDSDRLNNFKDVHYNSGEHCKEAYYESVIYTRNETIKILEEIEEIENGIQENWTDLQKTLYIYDKIKTTIMYDPRYNSKPSSETRSLRGLLTKQTICAGYSLILEEILERNGIQCQFVVGDGHAWNIIIIDDQMFSADLTSDNYAYRHGNKYTHTTFAQNETDFSRGRIPVREESNISYRGKLRTLSADVVEKIAASVVTEKDYEHTANVYTRADGTRFYLAQIGKKVIDGTKIRNTYRKYYYVDINKDGTYGEPKILYAHLDVFTYMNQIIHGESTTNDYRYTIPNVLFSKENIRNSELRNSGYIGYELRSYTNTPVQRVSEINKDLIDIRNTQRQTRIFKRRDKTNIIVEYLAQEYVNGTPIYSYTVYEMLPGKSKKTVKGNIIYTEENLLTTKKSNIGNYLLHRERLNKKSKESGGYIGYINNEGKLMFNNKIAAHYSKNKKTNLPDLYPNRPIILPDFKELEDLARTYEVVSDTSTKEIFVRNIKTKKKVESDRLALKAIFANIWLTSAATFYHEEDQRKGIRSAFDKEAKMMYLDICKIIERDFTTKGYIDTLSLYKIYKNIPSYRTSQNRSIIVNLFKNDFQTQYIHRLFYGAQQFKKATRYPETLYNVGYAEQLISQRTMHY